MGNVHMEASQINYRGGESKMSVEQAIKAGSSYQLPIAGAETLGGVKVGSGLSINSESGVLSASDQLPEDPSTDGIKVLVATTSSGETVHSWEEPSGGSIDYSTTEQNTGMKWIDGNDIYQRTFNITLGGSDDRDTLLISNLTPTAAWIKNSDFILTSGTEQFHFYLGSRVSGQLTTGLLIVKNGDLYLRTNNNYGAANNLAGKVTICYTKPSA